MRKTKAWSESDLKYLKDNYNKLSLDDISIALDRTVESVYNKAKKLKLHSQRKLAGSLQGESWKIIPGFSLYSVSNFGRVRNDETGKLIAQTERDGYLRVKISRDDGVRMSLSVHCLVADAFVPKTDPARNEVNHDDGVKTNNRSTNLVWVTHGENMQHAYDTELIDRKKNTGESNPVAVLTEPLVHKICKLFSQKKTVKQVQITLKLTHLSHACLGNIKNRKNWTSISCGYQW